MFVQNDPGHLILVLYKSMKQFSQWSFVLTMIQMSSYLRTDTFISYKFTSEKIYGFPYPKITFGGFINVGFVMFNVVGFITKV